MEDEPQAVGGEEQDNKETEQPSGQDGAAHAEEVKVEGDRGGHYGRKRPYEESRGYGYYEHREDKRYVYCKLLKFQSDVTVQLLTSCCLETCTDLAHHNLLLKMRKRT